MPCECLLLKDYVMDRRIASTLVFLPGCPYGRLIVLWSPSCPLWSPGCPCGHLIVLWSPSCPCGHLVVLVVTQLSSWSPGCPCGHLVVLVVAQLSLWSPSCPCGRLVKNWPRLVLAQCYWVQRCNLISQCITFVQGSCSPCSCSLPQLTSLGFTGTCNRASTNAFRRVRGLPAWPFCFITCHAGGVPHASSERVTLSLGELIIAW